MSLRFLSGLALVASGVLAPLGAQQVRGTVLTAEGARPLSGALVSLADSAGRVVLRTATSPSGAWLLTAPREGRWIVRVAAIGFAPSRPDTVALMLGAPVALRTTLTVQPFVLPEIVASDDRSRCTPNPTAADAVRRVLGEAETALRLVEATIAGGRLAFDTEYVERRWIAGTADTVVRTSRQTARAAWPVATADPALLERDGFMRDDPLLTPTIGYSGDAGPTYYAPDVGVLFAPWFVASHCFALEPGAEDELVLRYVPDGSRKQVEVGGTLVLDRTSLALRRLTFQFVGLPRWVPASAAEGELVFQVLPGGEWAPMRWRLRAPIRLERRALGAASREGFGGWVELAGQVLAVAPGR